MDWKFCSPSIGNNSFWLFKSTRNFHDLSSATYAILTISSTSYPRQLKMMNFAAFGKCIQQFLNCSEYFLKCLKRKFGCLFNSFLHHVRVLVFRVNPFWFELSYFVFLSVVGYGTLKASKPKIASFGAKSIDVLFTAVSAATNSSMSTIEMEVFSNIQLILLAALMLAGGEVFSSLIGLQLLKIKSTRNDRRENKADPFNIVADRSSLTDFLHQIELGMVSQHAEDKPDLRLATEIDARELRCCSIELLLLVVICYLLVVLVAGSILVCVYTITVPSAREILNKKDLNLLTFSAFMSVSTFSNGGFVPTNENMMVFKKNSGLLLILIPQVLLGNTLYPACLRFMIWFLEKITKRAEFTYMLKNSRLVGYNHLFSGSQSKFLAITAFGFLMIQFISFCSFEWHSEATNGLNAYQKLVGSLFQVVNSRHAGESVFDLSLVTPAMVLLFVVMMYLPPYISFMPIKDGEAAPTIEKRTRKERKSILDHLSFSNLIYLVIFIILICITERDNMKEDPLNFNVFNILVEVVSAYGNVGFSMGFSCGRQIKHLGHCKDPSYGFAGRWSNKGKLILIIVMLYGKIKKFTKHNGKAWGSV